MLGGALGGLLGIVLGVVPLARQEIPRPNRRLPGGRRSRSRRKVLQEAHPQERARGVNNPPALETPARPCSETPAQGAARGKKWGSGLWDEHPWDGSMVPSGR